MPQTEPAPGTGHSGTGGQRDPEEQRSPAGPAVPLSASADAVACEAPPAAEDDQVPLAESFLTLWLRPRETVRRIVARKPGYMVLAIVALGGIPQLLAAFPRSDVGLSLDAILLTGLLLGPLLGIFSLYLGAWMTGLTGRWFLAGRASGLELRTALGWSALPHVVALPLWLLATAAFGAQMYTARSELLGSSPVYLLFALTNMALQLWGLVIASNGVAQVQGFASAWKGLWNLVLAFLLALALLLAFALLLLVAALLLGRTLR